MLCKITIDKIYFVIRKTDRKLFTLSARQCYCFIIPSKATLAASSSILQVRI